MNCQKCSETPVKIIEKSSGGIGLSTVLGIIFITLKLCGVITWSWLWVLSPFWIPIVLGLTFIGIILIILLVSFLILLIFGK